MMRCILFPLVFSLVMVSVGCSVSNENSSNLTPEHPVTVVTTAADGSSLFSFSQLDFAKNKDARLATITIDTAQQFQAIEGFGYTLTGGSATLLRQIAPAERTKLLQELFGIGSNALGISYLRLSMGASDLDAQVFSYDDIPAGQTDIALQHFSLGQDLKDLVPLLKEILAIRPALKIMATPWSPPLWMKTNGNSIGGNLKPEYYGIYAQYFVKYIQAMQAHGITIEAITPQNEPQHGGNNPSMLMSWQEQAEFIKKYLGPAFQAAGVATKIIIWDHNCDNPNYPLQILNDSEARPFISGTAFHLYGGDESAFLTLYQGYPDKKLYFTEQWTGSKSDFGGDLIWHLRHVIIGTLRNYSSVALEWNLANDPDFGPHTPGGCTECRGALTIDGQRITRNVSYYIIGQASKYITAGSIRLGSTNAGSLQNVAFRTPEGKKVLLVLNETDWTENFNIQCGSQWITAALTPKSARTFVW